MNLIINNFSVKITLGAYESEEYINTKFRVTVFQNTEKSTKWYDTYHCKNEIELIKVLFDLHEELRKQNEQKTN